MEVRRKLIYYIEEIEKKWTWNGTYRKAVQLAKELGETTEGKYLERKSWFWNSKVQKAVKEKKAAFEEWQQATNNKREQSEIRKKEENYIELNGISKVEVAKAKEAGYEKMYEYL